MKLLSLLYLVLFSLSAFSKADSIIVYKGQKRLLLIQDEKAIKEYKIALGPTPAGHKVMEGDGKTPEGQYTITWKKKNSDFFRALYINYPNKTDKKKAKSLGVSPGGNIFIHGLPNQLDSYPKWLQPILKNLSWMHSYYNWTNGCIAVTNKEIQEIWQLIDVGTPIIIYP